jgi:DNA-binding LacI/PurR family transcriptional regulator
MADVARLAGVSHQTVSRVLNGHPHVTPATRGRVERAIHQLGYRRNTAARALVTRRHGVLGVVSVGSSNYGPANTLIGIEAAARADGYSVSFVSLEQVDRGSMQGALDHLTGAGVDGILVLSPTRSAVEAVRGLSADVPVVTISGTTSAGRPTVVIDQERGARLATAHLLDLGHATVHHVRGPDDWLEAEARVSGWRAELRARAVPVADCPVGDWSAASGYAAGRLLAARADVTAVFVANDQMALGVLLALSEAGRAVPDDVSVVGFDDIPEAAYLRPPLTTVRQDFAELGRRCLRQLVALIDDRPAGVRATIEPELVVRASSAPAR